MKARNYLFLVLALFYASNLLSSVSTLDKDKTVVLTLVKFIPSGIDEGWALGRPIDISLDINRNIYVLDSQANKIFVFDKHGKKRNEIGRRGQGPGEFLVPISMTVYKDKIAVYEIGSKRVQFLNTNGKYINTFKTMSSLYPLRINKEFVFGITSKRSKDFKNFINVFNVKGEKVNEFGEVLPYENFLVNRALLAYYNDKLYTAFRFHPELRVYSLKGKLENFTKFKKMDYREYTKGNYDPKNYKIINSRFNLEIFFNAMVVNKWGVFLSHPMDIKTRKGLVIDQFDHHFKFLQRFSYSDIGNVSDFEVTKELDNYRFYILGNNLEHIPVIAECVSGR